MPAKGIWIEQINPTTYEIELLGKDKVEIGDKDSADFKPHIKLNRWDGECFIKVGLPTSEKPVPIVEGNKVKWAEQDREVDFYSLEPRTVIAKDKEGNDVEFKQCELGGFEFEVILKKKPNTNKIVLNIETQELIFYYQPPLTPEEIAEGCIRPDNVMGSYAVYHATRGNMHRGKADAEKYKCGKAFHIYRPKIADAEGKWVWGELSLDEEAGTLTTTIPQEFLDTATYPVSTGTSNFGWEGIGGTNVSHNDYIVNTIYACPAVGTTVSVSLYVGATSGDLALAVYNADKTLNCITVESAIPADFNDWKTLNTTTAGVLSIANFRLAHWTTGINYYFDAGATSYLDYEGYDYPNFPDPVVDEYGPYDRKISIFCTYEEAPPPVAIPRYPAVNFQDPAIV